MFAVADQRRFAPWLVASALAHALGAALFVALRALPSPPPAPAPLRVVRVDLVGAPAASAPAPVAVAAPAPAAPAPRPVAARKPAAVKPAVRSPASAPLAEAPPAPVVAAVAGSGAGEAAAPASVSAAPPAGPGAGSGGGADAIASYIASLQRAIDAHKSYPPMARRRGIEGVVTVRLAIDATGGLERTALVGRPPEILARATRDAVDRAKPFPPPPAGALQIDFPVRYEIVE